MNNYDLSEGAATLNSVFWDTLGWTHCTCDSFQIPPDYEIKVPTLYRHSKKKTLSLHKSCEPKVQISNLYPHGELPKAVVVHRIKQKYSKLDRKQIINDLNINPKYLRPRTVHFKKGTVILRRDCEVRLPYELYLDLEIFDNKDYETRNPEEWLELGVKDSTRKPVPAIAYLPKKYRSQSKVEFEWQDVVVLSYCDKKEKYLVRRKCDCPKKIKKMPVTVKLLESAKVGEYDDIYLSRIYISFLNEDPVKYVQRLASAINDRHKIEESLRFSFYIDCMPFKYIVPESFTDIIRDNITKNYFRSMLPDWGNTKLKECTKEIQLIYRYIINRRTYEEITNQKSCLAEEVPLGYKRLEIPQTGYKISFTYSLKKKISQFTKNAYLTPEIVKVLLNIQKQLLILLQKPVFIISSRVILSMQEFLEFQKRNMKQIYDYIHVDWISAIAVGIKSELKIFSKGHFNLQENNWYAYQSSKLSRVIRTVAFKMQDTTRTLVQEALKSYVQAIYEACYNVMELPENYKWIEGFNTTARAPLNEPLFKIEAEIKGNHMKFSSDLPKFRDNLIELFHGALQTITEIPYPDLFVMEKLVLDQDRILESVNQNESKVKTWLQVLVTGMEKAILAMYAYAESYDNVLSHMETDQITYVKTCQRGNETYEDLKGRIENHMVQITKLSGKVPDFINIGPFHVITKHIKTEAVKKHEILGKALVNYFITKLGDFMGDIIYKFTSLQEEIKHPAGNIKDLLDKIEWFDSVPYSLDDLENCQDQLRKCIELLGEFYSSLDNDRFKMYWNIMGLSYNTVLVLEERISGIDEEKKYLRELLENDKNQLSATLAEASDKIKKLAKFKNVSDAAQYQTEVRQIRRMLDKCQEQAQLYNNQEILFKTEVTNYDNIDEIIEKIMPYELLWYSIADFYRWKEHDASDEKKMDEEDLLTTISECYSKLCSCPSFFQKKFILKIISKVRKEMEEYRYTRFGIPKPDYKDKRPKPAADSSG